MSDSAVDVVRLRQLANAATPSPWREENGIVLMGEPAGGGLTCAAYAQPTLAVLGKVIPAQADAEFIAYLSPGRVKALCAAIELAWKELEDAAHDFEQIAGMTAHKRGCDEPDDPSCSVCVATSAGARAREALRVLKEDE